VAGDWVSETFELESVFSWEFYDLRLYWRALPARLL